ncbi:hypothetical protein [Acidisphaera rubrifaciens]|uniref:Pectate lyase superfamily protein domain-containing protein n=1 Tax=Acidisphaera rubrifaciens HS-AP3 TaxID=1231350 RepID=A0A0D6PBC5_9PROT|nr:hypothetical protein [Acidisphaera rubrifaciens]GAN78154.1 hypothetical protein Asru_0659_02 [Acidisphaera rubrifaciens HS-AP3]
MTNTYMIDVTDFGGGASVGTGGDDTAAFNAAFAALRTATSGTVLGGPPRTYHIGGTINATGLTNSVSTMVSFPGAQILGTTNGGTVIDALGSRWTTWVGLNVGTAPGITGRIGMQLGAAGPNMLGDCHTLSGAVFCGQWSLAPLYLFCTETSLFSGLKCYNNCTAAGAHALIVDACNHFGMRSSFVPVTAAVDTPQSYNECLFAVPDLRTMGDTPLMIVGATRRHRYDNGYAECSSSGAAVPGILLIESSGPSQMLTLDIHIERNISDHILFDAMTTGPAATTGVSINGLVVRDHGSEAKQALFARTANLPSGVHLYNSELNINPAGNAVLWDDPTAYNFDGRIATWYAPTFTAPGTIDGETDIAGVTTAV